MTTPHTVVGATCDGGEANPRVSISSADPGAVAFQLVKDACGGLASREHQAARAHAREQPAGDFAQ